MENTQEQVGELVEQFNEVTESAEDAEDAGEQMAENMVESMSEASEETEGASENVEQLSNNNEKAAKTSSKLGTAMKSLLKSLAISAAIWVLSQAINAIINQVNALENEVKNLQDAVQDSIKEYQNAISEIETIDERLEEIKNRVDEINENNIELISEDELKQLEQETELLQLQKQNLEEIAKLKQQAAQTQIDKLLNNTDAFYMTENGLEAGFTGFKGNYAQKIDNVIGTGNIWQEAAKGFLTEIPFLSETGQALAYAIVGSDDNYRKTQAEHIEDMLSKYDSLISINQSLSSSAMTNAEILKQYLNNQDEISEIETALSEISSTLNEQLSTLPEDSEIYKQISEYISKITTSINEGNKTPESTAVQVYNNYANSYEGFEEGYVKYKDIIEKGKNLYQDKEKIFVAGTNERYEAFSALQNGNDSKILNELLSKHNIIMQGGSLTAQSYEDLLAFQYDLNQAKQSGLMTDKENLEILNKLLKNLTGIDGSECTVYIRYEQEQGMYDELFNGTYNGINYSEVGVDNYLLFKNGFISAMKTQGKDTELAEAILANMFPNFQTKEDRLKEAFSSVPQISSVKEELFAYARANKLTSDILDKYNLKDDFAALGMTANEACDYIEKLTQALLNEAQAASKAKIQELNNEFNTNKADYDENYKNKNDTFDNAIQKLETNKNASFTYDEMWALIEADNSLASEFDKTANGYTINIEKLYSARKRYQEVNKRSYLEAIQDASIQKTLAETEKKKLENALLNSTDLTDQRRLSSELQEQKDIIAEYDDIIAKNKLMYEQCSKSVISYTEAITNSVTALKDWVSLYETAVNDVSLTGQLTPETLSKIMEMGGDDWTKLVKKNDIGYTVDFSAFNEKVLESTDLNYQYKAAKQEMVDINNEMKQLASKHKIDIEFTGDFETDYQKVFAEFEKLGNGVIVDTGIHLLDEEFMKASLEANILAEAIEGIKDQLKELETLTAFNTKVSGIDAELGQGIINTEQRNAKYADAVAEFRTTVEENGQITDPEVATALASAEAEVHQNSQSQLQKELDKETKLIQEAYADRLIDADEYNRQMSALEDKYYGTSDSRGLLDDPDGTNLDTVAEQRKARVTEMYEGSVADADKLLEQGLINETQYTGELRRLWEKYYKDRTGFAQESYEAEKRFLDAAKSSIQAQIDGIQSLIDDNSAYYEGQIAAIEEQNEKIEEKYDAEIEAIDKQIELLENKNDEEDKYLKIKEAEAELEKASQRTRKVYGADGTVGYRQDPKAIKEAEEAVVDAKVEVLEDEKSKLEEQRDAELEVNNDRIEALNAELAALNDPLEDLIAILAANLAESYQLSPEAIAAILATDSSEKELDKVNKQNAIAGDKTYSMGDVATIAYDAASKYNSETVSQTTKDGQIKEAYTVIDTGNYESALGSKVQQLVQLMMTSTHTNADMEVGQQASNTWKRGIEDYNVKGTQSVELAFNGNIYVTNPIGDSKDLAYELAHDLPNAFMTQIYTNIKK